MKTIYKYPLSAGEGQEIKIPGLCRVLSADVDPKGQLCIWALVNPNFSWEQAIEVFIRGTGYPADGMIEKEGVIFLNTVIIGPLVWHIFYKLL